MKANLEELGEMLTELFKQQCDLDIQKAMVKHFIKEKQAEQLNLTDVVKPFYCDNADERLIKCNKQCKYCLKLDEQ